MTGISTEPATTLPSPSGTKRGISLTTLKASLSNRGSSLVFTAPEGETTVPEASKATVAVTVADAEGEPFTVSQEDADGIAAVESYENVHAKSQAKDKNGKVIKECNFTDVHLVKGKQTCYEGNFFDNTSSASFTVSMLHQMTVVFLNISRKFLMIVYLKGNARKKKMQQQNPQESNVLRYSLGKSNDDNSTMPTLGTVSNHGWALSLMNDA